MCTCWCGPSWHAVVVEAITAGGEANVTAAHVCKLERRKSSPQDYTTLCLQMQQIHSEQMEPRQWSSDAAGV
jgi:hypothetical protein